MVGTSSWIASCCMAIDCRTKHVCRTIGLGGLPALHFARSTPSGMCSQEVVDHPYIYIYILYIPMLWGIISPYTTGGITNLLSGMHPYHQDANLSDRNLLPAFQCHLKKRTWNDLDFFQNCCSLVLEKSQCVSNLSTWFFELIPLVMDAACWHRGDRVRW